MMTGSPILFLENSLDLFEINRISNVNKTSIKDLHFVGITIQIHYIGLIISGTISESSTAYMPNWWLLIIY